MTTLTVAEAADLVGGRVVGDSGQTLAGVASLAEAGPGDLSFLTNTRYRDAFRDSRATAVLLSAPQEHLTGGPATRIVVPDPHRALARLIDRLYPPTPPSWGIDPTARIGPGVRWQGRIRLMAGTTIGPRTRFGADCIVGAGATIGTDVRLGDRCRIAGHVSIASESVLGHDVVLHEGVRIGTRGFGFVDTGEGHAATTHVGQCVIGDQVEIGANSTLDRGSVGDTRVGDGTKIDNLVHLGHNVRLGRRCLVLAQVGIGGSTVVGDDVVLAGQAGIAGHLHVGRGARVAAQGGVIGDVPNGATVSGYPARSHRQVLRQAAAVRRLAPLVDRLETLARGNEAR